MKKQYTKEELLEKLRNFYDEYGRTPSREDLKENKDFPSYGAYYRYFGSFNIAKREADIPIHPSSKTYTKEELLEMLRTFYENYGRTPTEKDLRECDYLAGEPTFRRHFGSFNEAKKEAGIPIYEFTSKLDSSGDLIKEWAEEMNDEISKATLEGYHRSLRDFEIFIEKRGKNIKDLTFKDIKNYCNFLIEKKYRKCTIEKKLAGIKSLFVYIERNAKLTEQKPIIRTLVLEKSRIYIKKKLSQITRRESNRLPSLTEEEIKEVRKKLQDEILLLTLFELDLNLGLRASEFKYIKAKVGEFTNVNGALEKDLWLDLREGKGKMLLYRQKRKFYHLIALTDDMIEVVKRQLLLRKLYGVTHDHLFFGVRGGYLTKGRVFKYYEKMSKIVNKDEIREKKIILTSHRLRRTMNTLLELKYIPNTVRRMRMGHAPETQTDRYSILDLDARRMYLETVGML